MPHSVLPLSAQRPDRRSSSLARRVQVVLGMNPTMEGDGTAMYLAQRLESLGVKVTRLARGMPTGSSMQTVSKAVLSDAVQGRGAMPPE